MLGVDSARDRCMMYVAVADQQSFQVAIYPQEGQHLGMVGCDMIKQLASEILHKLNRQADHADGGMIVHW